MDLRITGGEELGDLSRALKSAGATDLRRELYRGINRATKPLKAKAQQAAGANLPQSGGLAALVGRSKFSTRTLAGRDPRVSITVKGTALATDKGYVSHPVFGNRGAWVRQPVSGAGWFSNTMRESASDVRKEILEAMEDVADQIRRA
jgi:hypothetical protein